MAGPVPARVDGSVKAGLLDLLDHAVGNGWSSRRACNLLGVDDLRAARWAGRLAEDRLDDAPPGGHPVHGILAWERAAIVELFERWGGRPVPPQIGAPRFADRPGACQRVHGAPGARGGMPCAAGESAA